MVRAASRPLATGHESARMRARLRRDTARGWACHSARPQQWPHRKELVERQLAVEDVAAGQAIVAFEVQWRDDLRGEDLLANARTA